MRPGRDLMERLAAADPMRDAEPLGAADQREADALLERLLATPAGPAVGERRARRPRVRRWVLLAAGAAASAVVALAGIDLLDPDPPGTSVVDKAVAAVTRENSVYHVLQRLRGTGNVPGARSGPFYRESWHSSDGRRHEKVFAAKGAGPGRLLEEVAGRRRPGRSFGPLLRYDPRENKLYPSGFGRGPGADKLPTIDPQGDPGGTLRQLQAQGLLRVAGTTRIGNKSAYRLVSDPISRFKDEEERFEYLVDAGTYLPLIQRYSMRQGSETVGFVTEFLVYERLPLDAASRSQLDLDPHPGATCAIGAGELRGDRGLGFPNPCPPSGREGPARAR